MVVVDADAGTLTGAVRRARAPTPEAVKETWQRARTRHDARAWSIQARVEPSCGVSALSFRLCVGRCAPTTTSASCCTIDPYPYHLGYVQRRPKPNIEGRGSRRPNTPQTDSIATVLRSIELCRFIAAHGVSPSGVIACKPSWAQVFPPTERSQEGCSWHGPVRRSCLSTDVGIPRMLHDPPT